MKCEELECEVLKCEVLKCEVLKCEELLHSDKCEAEMCLRKQLGITDCVHQSEESTADDVSVNNSPMEELELLGVPVVIPIFVYHGRGDGHFASRGVLRGR